MANAAQRDRRMADAAQREDRRMADVPLGAMGGVDKEGPWEGPLYMSSGSTTAPPPDPLDLPGLRATGPAEAAGPAWHPCVPKTCTQYKHLVNPTPALATAPSFSCCNTPGDAVVGATSAMLGVLWAG